MRLDATYYHYLDIQAKDQSGKVVWKTTKDYGGGVYSGDEEAYVVKGVYPRDLVMRAEDRGGMYIAFGYGSNGWASSDPFNRQASCKVGKWDKGPLKYQVSFLEALERRDLLMICFRLVIWIAVFSVKGGRIDVCFTACFRVKLYLYLHLLHLSVILEVN